ncbi:hypothetical protein NFI96_032222 [Prochilodus magdalenae]|nr:hypothetical protein NFI96_032222 [Prochilodus magdalenae]
MIKICLLTDHLSSHLQEKTNIIKSPYEPVHSSASDGQRGVILTGQNDSSDVETAESPKHAAEPSASTASKGQRGVNLAVQNDSSDVETAESPKHAAEPSASTASKGQRGVNLAVQNDSSDVETAESPKHAAEPSASTASKGQRGVNLAVQNDSSDVETAESPKHAAEPSGSSNSDGQRGVILAGQNDSSDVETAESPKHAAEPSASTASKGQRGVNLAVQNDSSDVETAESPKHAAEPSASTASKGQRGVNLAVQNDSSDLETAKITEQAPSCSSASDGQRGVILAGQGSRRPRSLFTKKSRQSVSVEISSDVDESSDCSQHNYSDEDYDPHLDGKSLDYTSCDDVSPQKAVRKKKKEKSNRSQPKMTSAKLVSTTASQVSCAKTNISTLQQISSAEANSDQCSVSVASMPSSSTGWNDFPESIFTDLFSTCLDEIEESDNADISSDEEDPEGIPQISSPTTHEASTPVNPDTSNHDQHNRGKKRKNPEALPDQSHLQDCSSTQNNDIPQNRRKWSDDEVHAVEKHLMRFINSCRLPGKKDCVSCLLSETDTLRSRDWIAVKNYVRNRIVALKRKQTM